MYELALFAGAGGGILGGILCGHTCIGAVEIEDYPRKVLLARQDDGILPRFPIWDDIRTFRSDNPECAEYFDLLRSVKDELVVSGGFPCQNLSPCGDGEGIDGVKSGLWREMARIISEIRPARIFMENSPFVIPRGLPRVAGELAEMGYDTRWCVLGAGHVAAVHARERWWLLAYPEGAHVEGTGLPFGGQAEREIIDMDTEWARWWATQPPESRMDDGLAGAMDRLRAIGNGQVPSVVSLAWHILHGH